MTEAWKLGSDPTGHPLWERQVELELAMVERGAERYRSKLAKARDKQEMTALRPYRRVLEDMVDAMGDGVKAWLQGSEKAAAVKVPRGKKRGAKGIAFGRLQGMEPYLLAYITARAVLDGITINKYWLNRTARAVGVQVEYEARMAAWCDREPGLFNEVQRGLTAQKATAKHRKRVNINKFNKLIKVKQRWRDWSHDEHLHVGLKLLDILQRTSGHIEIMRDPSFIAKKRSGGKQFGAKSAPYIVTASEELLDYLAECTHADEDRTPLYLPTIMPPKQWEGVRKGGYYTPLVRLPRLIRFKANNEEAQGIAAEEYDSLDMPDVFSALNKVQEVPWRVNKRVLAVANEAWERNMGIGKLMKREAGRMGSQGKMVPRDMPPANPGQRREDLTGPARKEAERLWQKENPKLFQEWKREAAKKYGEFARSVSNVRSTQDTLGIADRFADEEFYFPHMLDFRGRMYPIPAYLQPQGNDLARGLLTFACGAPVGEWGLYWLGVHLANVWGNDKISFDERRDWAEENFPLWARIADNPLGSLEWTQLKNPWQALAAVLEYVRVGSAPNPELEVSSLPLRVDGTCNGIQHLSAMMRDAVGGASVNLLPGDAPRDIYGEVATILQERLEGIRESGGREGKMAAMWLKAFPGGQIMRDFTKGPVMVTPYGGTKDSFKGSVMEWLKENDPEAIPDKKGRKYNLRFEATLWIVPHLWDAVAGRVVEGHKCMEWLKSCARLVAGAEQPIWWTTETGFQIRHFYGTRKQRRIKTQVDGKQIYLVDWERTSKLSKKDQLQGIAPNFVHSQDASVNMETILAFMDPETPPPFTTIHDAFGTVAGRMWDLFGIIREAFIKIHSGDVLSAFRQRCVMMLRDYYMATKPGWALHRAWEEAEDMMPVVPSLGALEIGGVRDADYFFA